MYSCSLSEASRIDSIPIYLKLEIFPCKALVLPSGKEFMRNTVELLFHMLTGSLSSLTHCFAFPMREKENRWSLMASAMTPLMMMVSQRSRKFCRCALASSFSLSQNGLACTMLMRLDLSSKLTSPTVMLCPVATLAVEGLEKSRIVFSAITIDGAWMMGSFAEKTSHTLPYFHTQLVFYRHAHRGIPSRW
jgi:hypothetical protein